MGQLDFIKIRHLNYFFAITGLFCLLDAAALLHDLQFLVMGCIGGVGAYFIGRKWQDEESALGFRHALVIYKLPFAFLLVSLLVLAVGLNAVEHLKWLFTAQAVLAGLRLKSS